MKSGLMVFAAALLAAGVAQATEVKESTQLAAPVAKVWSLVAPFCSVADWHPAVEKCELRRRDGVLERAITVKGGAVIEEKLLASSDTKHSVSYTILASPLPVKDYTATLALEPAGKATKITWKAKFTPANASEADARKAISGIFTSGFDGLKKVLGE